jgi:hypothetical protein
MQKLRIQLWSIRSVLPGTKIGDRIVEVCRECNESGVQNEFQGKVVIFHGISAVPNEEDGAIEFKDDVCIKAENK